MSELLTKEETALLGLLRDSLAGKAEKAPRIEDSEWQRICAIAGRHSVLSLLWQSAQGSPGEAVCRQAAERCAAQFYHLLILTRRCVRVLGEAGIETVVLKGPGAACYYPVPELRQSGDIDLLLKDPAQIEAACRALEADGAVPEEEQHANHHMSLRTPDGITVELHSSLVEDFDDPAVNAITASAQRDIAEHAVIKEVFPNVPLPVPDESGQASSLLLHMLQHFMRAGFGLKLICDWTVFWNRMPEGSDLKRYEAFIDECGLRGFSDMLAGVCSFGLGLKPGKVYIRESFKYELCEEYLREIFDAESFGHSSPGRMVMVRGGLGGYIREFHHQMRLNFPKAGRYIPLWPALWTATLARFLGNNRRIRRTSTADILKETGRRSRLAKPLRLFER